MVSVTSASHYVTSASRYQSRSSMYIGSLIPQNSTELADAVQIEKGPVPSNPLSSATETS